MKILLNNSDLNEALIGISRLGFIPTMGGLHKGHISLIKKSIKECKKTIVSIFVNPTQFNNQRDYQRYPRNEKKDLSLLEKLKVDYVYMPKKKHIYNSRKKKIKLANKDKILCAKFRKGHFEGVIDVMDRLTKLINPYMIFMGEKDYQQIFLVKKNIQKKFRSKIIPCKTIRDKNKLALSTRNFLLNKSDLIKAGKIAKNIILFKKNVNHKNYKINLLLEKRKELEKKYEINFEYFELRNKKNLKLSKKMKNSKIFIAYHLKKIRLIDNF